MDSHVGLPQHPSKRSGKGANPLYIFQSSVKMKILIKLCSFERVGSPIGNEVAFDFLHQSTKIFDTSMVRFPFKTNSLHHLSPENYHDILNMKKVVGSAHHPRFWPKYNISPTSLPCHVNDSITAGNCRPMITSKSETNNWDIEVSPANISPTWISPEIRGCPFLSYLLG